MRLIRQGRTIATVALLGAATSARGQDDSAEGLVYEFVRIFSEADDSVDSLFGPTTVQTSAGEEYVDPETLTDSDGNTYELVATFGQDSHDGPPTSRVTLRRVEHRRLSPADLEEIWLRTHPDEELSELWARRGALTGPFPDRPSFVADALLTAAALDALSQHPDVARVEEATQYQNDTNGGTAIRRASQIDQFLT